MNKSIVLLLSLVLSMTVSKPSLRAPRWAVDTVNPAPDAQPDYYLEDTLSNTGLSSLMYVWLSLASIPLIVILCCLFRFRSYVLDYLQTHLSVAAIRVSNCATFRCSEHETTVDREDIELPSMPVRSSDEGLRTEGIQVRYDDVLNLVYSQTFQSAPGARRQVFLDPPLD